MLTWTTDPPAIEGVYLVQWNTAFSPNGHELFKWSEEARVFEFQDGSEHPWPDAVLRRSSEPLRPFGMCGCGLELYESLDIETGERLGVTHVTSDEEDHHNSFWRSATPSDIVGSDNARRLGLTSARRDGEGG